MYNTYKFKHIVCVNIQKSYNNIDNSVNAWYNKSIINPTSLLFYGESFPARPFFMQKKSPDANHQGVVFRY